MAFDSTVPVSVRCEDAIIGERCATSSIGITKNRPTHGLTVPDITSFKRETWSRMKASDGSKGPGTTTCFFFFLSCFLFLFFYSIADDSPAKWIRYGSQRERKGTLDGRLHRKKVVQHRTEP